MTITPSPRIGVISFSDGRQRVHEGLKEGILREQAKLVALLKELGATPVCGRIGYRLHPAQGNGPCEGTSWSRHCCGCVQHFSIRLF